MEEVAMADATPPEANSVEREFWDRRFDDETARPRSERAFPPRPSFPVGASDGAVARLREWIKEWRGDPRVGVVVLVVVALVAGVVWYRIGVGGGNDSAGAASRATAAPATHAAATTT